MTTKKSLVGKTYKKTFWLRNSDTLLVKKGKYFLSMEFIDELFDELKVKAPDSTTTKVRVTIEILSEPKPY